MVLEHFLVIKEVKRRDPLLRTQRKKIGSFENGRKKDHPKSIKTII
jgi:hypothetical protein